MDRADKMDELVRSLGQATDAAALLGLSFAEADDPRLRQIGLDFEWLGHLVRQLEDRAFTYRSRVKGTATR